MNPSLNTRLSSLALAAAITLAMLLLVDTLAIHDRGPAQFARTAASAPA